MSGDALRWSAGGQQLDTRRCFQGHHSSPTALQCTNGPPSKAGLASHKPFLPVCRLKRADAAAVAPRLLFASHPLSSSSLLSTLRLRFRHPRVALIFQTIPSCGVDLCQSLYLGIRTFFSCHSLPPFWGSDHPSPLARSRSSEEIHLHLHHEPRRPDPTFPTEPLPVSHCLQTPTATSRKYVVSETWAWNLFHSADWVNIPRASLPVVWFQRIISRGRVNQTASVSTSSTTSLPRIPTSASPGRQIAPYRRHRRNDGLRNRRKPYETTLADHVPTHRFPGRRPARGDGGPRLRPRILRTRQEMSQGNTMLLP